MADERPLLMMVEDDIGLQKQMRWSFDRYNLMFAGDRETALATLRRQPAVVNFWATWCPPCVEEMPELSDIGDEFRGRGLQIIGIGIDSAPNIGQFWRKTPMRYPLVVAGNSGLELVRRLGNTAGALPFTVVLSRDGGVAWRTLGRFKTAELREAIRRVL
jgi:thiol-disulfide isomerase/thioredoxin